MILKPNNYYNIIRMSDWNYAHCRRFEIPHHIDFKNTFLTSIVTESNILQQTNYSQKISIVLNRRKTTYDTFIRMVYENI